MFQLTSKRAIVREYVKIGQFDMYFDFSKYQLSAQLF